MGSVELFTVLGSGNQDDSEQNILLSLSLRDEHDAASARDWNVFSQNSFAEGLTLSVTALGDRVYRTN